MIIDTSSNVLYLAFLDDEREIYQVTRTGKNDHSEHLINLLQLGLVKTNLDLKDFGQIIVGIGPGSYTGLRLALSVAKMFAWTANLKLYTISSLDILSSGKRNQDGIYITALKAKKGYVYANVIERKNNQEVRLLDDSYLEDSKLTEIINQYPQAILIHDEYFLDSKIILKSQFLTLQEDIHLVVPNYLRGAF